MYTALIMKALIAVILIVLLTMLVHNVWAYIGTIFNTLVFG